MAVQKLSDAGNILCWASIRALLTASSEAKLEEFASKHKKESFYCLCVYFDRCYGDFFLYLNVPEEARKTAERSKKLYPDMYKKKSVEQIEKQSKWNCGDFKYRLFGEEDEGFARFWEPVKAAYEWLVEQMSEQMSVNFQELGISAACLTALDLEGSDVLKLIKKTPDFRVICVDHDETIEESSARLKRIRKIYKPFQR